MKYMRNDYDPYMAYPYHVRELLKGLEAQGLSVWSSDAAASKKNDGKGFYIPADKLLEILEMMLED